MVKPIFNTDEIRRTQAFSMAMGIVTPGYASRVADIGHILTVAKQIEAYFRGPETTLGGINRSTPPRGTWQNRPIMAGDLDDMFPPVTSLGDIGAKLRAEQNVTHDGDAHGGRFTQPDIGFENDVSHVKDVDA